MEKQLNQEESLRIIRSMIDTAKEDLSDNGFMFLLWGWLVLAAAILNYVLMVYTNFPHSYIGWPVLMGAGGVISGIYGVRNRKQQKVRTYVDSFFAYLWGAFGISLFIVLMFMSKLGVASAYPMIMILYGIGTFVSGGILRFRPLIIGGLGCWGVAVAAIFVGFEYQLLLLALSVLVSYIIPGHLLKISHAKTHGSTLQTANR